MKTHQVLREQLSEMGIDEKYMSNTRIAGRTVISLYNKETNFERIYKGFTKTQGPNEIGPYLRKYFGK